MILFERCSLSLNNEFQTNQDNLNAGYIYFSIFLKEKIKHVMWSLQVYLSVVLKHAMITYYL